MAQCMTVSGRDAAAEPPWMGSRRVMHCVIALSDPCTYPHWENQSPLKSRKMTRKPTAEFCVKLYRKGLGWKF